MSTLFIYIDCIISFASKNSANIKLNQTAPVEKKTVLLVKKGTKGEQIEGKKPKKKLSTKKNEGTKVSRETWSKLRDQFIKNQTKIQENWEDPVFSAKSITSHPTVGGFVKLCCQIKKASEEWINMFIGDLGGLKILLDLFLKFEYESAESDDFWNNEALRMMMIIYTLNCISNNKIAFDWLLNQVNWEDIFLLLTNSLDSTSALLHEFSINFFLKAFKTDPPKARELLDKFLREKQKKNREPLKNKFESFILIFELEEYLPAKTSVINLFNAIIDDLKVLEER